MPVSFLNRLFGRYLRTKGRYNKLTLRRYALALAISGAPRDRLLYALFRRDLGMPIPSRWVGKFISALPDFSVAERRLALGLIAEVSQPSIRLIDPAFVIDGMGLPGVASQIEPSSNAVSGLSCIDKCQSRWRLEFLDVLRRASSIAVIGNAAAVDSSLLKEMIEQSDLVVRFNNFMGSESSHLVGERTDIWVLAPGYEGPLPEEVSWVVMSGPDMRYRLWDWRFVMPLVDRGVRLLTVPLPIWRGLVFTLNAPPSAGLLFLAWLKSQLDGGWDRVAIAGIGTGAKKGVRYHASLPNHQPSKRHAWKKEAELVNIWRQEGLVSLDRP